MWKLIVNTLKWTNHNQLKPELCVQNKMLLCYAPMFHFLSFLFFNFFFLFFFNPVVTTEGRVCQQQFPLQYVACSPTVSCHLPVNPWLVPIPSIFSLLFFCSLQPATSFTHNVTDSGSGACAAPDTIHRSRKLWISLPRGGVEEKKMCFSVISEGRCAVGVCRPLAFIRQNASSRTNTDALRSDLKLFSPSKWLWGGKRPTDGRALKGASVI